MKGGFFWFFFWGGGGVLERKRGEWVNRKGGGRKNLGFQSTLELMVWLCTHITWTWTDSTEQNVTHPKNEAKKTSYTYNALKRPYNTEVFVFFSPNSLLKRVGRLSDLVQAMLRLVVKTNLKR